MYDDWEGCNLIIMPLLINSMEPWIGDGLLTLMMDGKILNCGQNRSIMTCHFGENHQNENLEITAVRKITGVLIFEVTSAK